MTESERKTAAEAAASTTILNSATLLQGLTKSGKSSLLATLAEYGWETYRAVMFYYLVDGGGFPTQVQALINRGIIRLWRVRSRSAEHLAPETLQRASQGWWPAAINPKTGECAPTARLVSPTQTTFQVSCPDGHVIKTVATQAAIGAGSMTCPTCKKVVDRLTMKVDRTTTRTKGFPERRIVAFDGISAMQSWIMEDLSHRNLGGEASNLGGIVTSGDMTFGSNNRAQYGFAQGRAENWVLHSQGIPDLVVPPVWTALSAEGADEGGLTVVGPLLAGSAKTALAPQWFGNSMEAAVVERDGKKYRRLYLQQYVDDRNRRHLVGVRSYPGALPMYLEDEDVEDGSGAFTNFNLGLVHKLLDDARVRTEAQYAERFTDAPGMPEGDMTFGEEPAPAAAAAPAVRPAVNAPRPVVRPAAAPPTPAAAPANPAAPAAGSVPSAGPAPAVASAAGPAPAAARPATQPTAPQAAPRSPIQPPRPVVKPAPPAPIVAKPTMAPGPSPAATGPVAQTPPAPKLPQRAATPPPPGRPPAPAAAPPVPQKPAEPTT